MSVQTGQYPFRVSMIAAMARNRVIGIENRLPWHLPEDLKRFRALTQGHPVIMGRKTYESIGRPLPKRRNIIVTRNADYQPTHPEVEVALSLAEALDRVGAEPSGEVFLIGGAEMYRLALEEGLADRLYMTIIEQDFEGDAWFPKWDEMLFRETESESHRGGENGGVLFRYVTLDRVQG